ncbi:hypothetical protein E2562_031813 [Oryza meyeriana var. granulata]|uniref:Uncharacterized protein n=1 Tax=Oryza meyeriana var. granulata TaxID=110450 RepID=A0A6G1ECC5_9ORYZ|nr:hypothetical protein E2562_031813 [Oryza meyeriana var. granulata]
MAHPAAVEEKGPSRSSGSRLGKGRERRWWPSVSAPTSSLATQGCGHRHQIRYRDDVESGVGEGKKMSMADSWVLR